MKTCVISDDINVYSFVILTKELVMTTDDQCNVHKLKSPFHPGESCEDTLARTQKAMAGQDITGYYVDGPSKAFVA